MSAQVELAGQVTSGRGQATSHLFACRDELTCFVKKPLCPGTLNVVLNRPVRLRDAAAYVFDNGRRMIWPASLNGMDVWIYRWAAAPLHVAEIISPVHLRERFHYKDGDNIIVSLSDELITAISPVGRLAWGALWIGRRNWSYSSDTYYSKTMHWCMDLGAAQRPPTVEGTFQTGVYILKEIIKRTPVVSTLARRVQSKITGNLDKQGYIFSRLDTDSCATEEERLLLQIRNVLNFTKISNSTYSAQQFPAAYHTIKINGHQVLGQRDPSMRLALVPVDFRDKTILDLGCNQGGMIHQLANSVKWAVGVDYDPHMVNAATRIKNAMGANNTSFYVHDLQREPLALISDFLPDQKVDICFLLSVCMWLDNWKEVIDFAQTKSRSMLFETNGTSLQQQQQQDYLRTKYRSVNLLSETSEDDPIQKQRQLFYLSEPIALT